MSEIPRITVAEAGTHIGETVELAGWLYNTIAWPVDTDYAPSLAVDSGGRPHVVFVSGAGLGQINVIFLSYGDGTFIICDRLDSPAAMTIDQTLGDQDLGQRCLGPDLFGTGQRPGCHRFSLIQQAVEQVTASGSRWRR